MSGLIYAAITDSLSLVQCYAIDFQVETHPKSCTGPLSFKECPLLLYFPSPSFSSSSFCLPRCPTPAVCQWMHTDCLKRSHKTAGWTHLSLSLHQGLVSLIRQRRVTVASRGSSCCGGLWSEDDTGGTSGKGVRDFRVQLHNKTLRQHGKCK